MNARLDSDMTCNSAFLAGLFDCTKRHISNYVERGLPLLKRGARGTEHIFNGPLALRWFLGMRAIERMNKPLPPPLATVLCGIFFTGSEDWPSFSACLESARRLTKEAGYTDRQFVQPWTTC